MDGLTKWYLAAPGRGHSAAPGECLGGLGAGADPVGEQETGHIGPFLPKSQIKEKLSPV